MKLHLDEVAGIQQISVYDLEDFSIGHAADEEAVTGCTVVVANDREKLVGGSDVRGGAPGTRNLDIVKPLNSFEAFQAVVLSGGSLFGLAASAGVEKFLEEHGIGQVFGPGLTVPVVGQAIIFDLAIGSSKVRPDAAMGYRACENAWLRQKHPDGNVGGGIGACVGGMGDIGMKGGLGTCCLKKGDLYVGAVMVVNAGGDVVDPETGEILAGCLKADGTGLLETERFLLESDKYLLDKPKAEDNRNTTIGVVITNAAITRPEAHKLASWAHDGLARAIKPTHTMGDGDTMFAMATGRVGANMTLVGTMAVLAVERAIASAVKNAESLGGRKSWKEMTK